MKVDSKIGTTVVRNQVKRITKLIPTSMSRQVRPVVLTDTLQFEFRVIQATDRKVIVEFSHPLVDRIYEIVLNRGDMLKYFVQWVSKLAAILEDVKRGNLIAKGTSLAPLINEIISLIVNTINNTLQDEVSAIERHLVNYSTSDENREMSLLFIAEELHKINNPIGYMERA